ncbi:pyruvate dehydrogenase [Pseudomonas silvicola]|nr:pyruvate dehydrogenase [Pseudomonas silvicola]
MDTTHFPHTPDTGRAAQALMDKIRGPLAAPGPGASSPLYTLLDIANRLEGDPHTAQQIWVVRDTLRPGHDGGQISTWPLWFSEKARASEKPLLYLTQSPTSAELCALANQAADRGIVCNDIESSPSRWPKGAHPWLPLWLAANHQCLPYDPACSEEARAILLGALQALYVEGQPGFCYLTLHDEPAMEPTQVADPSAAFKGMYPVQGFDVDDSRPRIRLLGAGLSLREVRAAAHLLDERWGVQSEVWSCPSYTRLAREATSAERWNRLNPGRPRKTAHLHHSLAGSQVPIVAVTGYGQYIAEQLASHVRAPYCALGADSLGDGQPVSRHWIVVSALTELARQGSVDSALADRALSDARRAH